MNRRGFLARAAAAIGAVMATCSPIGIRLAEASEPKQDDYNRAFEGLQDIETESSVHPLYSPYGRAPIEDFIEADQQLQDKMWENIEPRAFAPPGQAVLYQPEALRRFVLAGGEPQSFSYLTERGKASFIKACRDLSS